ncbi:MAG TPA: ABC transporter substrate-binding protein [Anaerolineae bacterium]|nr:ABC transporter substrate-binding protein [Anaerolineae bacterium]
MKRFCLVMSLAMLLSIVLAACGPAAPSTIKIGLNAELTGGVPVVGESCKNGAELAVKEINDAGGLDVGGTKYKIELTVEDNEDKAESAAAAAQKLATAGVVAMIGPNASRNAIPAAEVAESSKMPMISPWSTNVKTTLDAQTGQPKKYVFRAAFIDDFQGVVAAKFALNELKTAKPAVLYDVASEYNKGIAEVYKKTMEENGVQVVSFETYTTGDKDFSSQLTKIKQTGADSLFLPNYYTEVPLQVQQAHKLGFTGPAVGSDSWGNLELITLCGADCEGLYFTTHYAADIATPKAQKFIKAYEAAYGKTPDDVAALTYDSFGLIFQSIQAAGKIDRESVRNALAAITAYEGVTGNMQFKGTGDPIKSAVVIQIKNGKFTYYQTANP